MNNKHILKLLIISLISFGPLVKAQENQVSQIKKDLLKAMGGEKAYNKTNIISWSFFGIRNLIWDKKNNQVRIDFSKENTVMILNLSDKTGKVMKNGREIMDKDSLAQQLDEARKIWINDSYWLFMPFKLSDPGVNLKLVGTQKTEEGKGAQVLEMTFENVGVTPENKYHIFIDNETHLVSQWSFYGNFKDEKPRFTMPWKDYQKYGNILLSGDRGTRKLSDIKVLESVEPSVFTEFKKPSFL